MKPGAIRLLAGQLVISLSAIWQEQCDSTEGVIFMVLCVLNWV